MGFLDRREESLILNQAQEQAVLKHQKLYGTKHARDIYTEPRSASGRNRVMPFWN